MSVWNNPEICVGKKSIYWKKWVKEGMHTSRDLHRDEFYPLFDEMCAQDIWRYIYIHIKSCATKVYDEMHKETNATEELFSNTNIKQTASVCYKK